MTVSAAEAANKFGHYVDQALRQPVAIQWHGATRIVLISLQEHHRLLRRDRQVLLAKDLDDEMIDAIRNAQPSERSKALNYLMEDPGTE